MQKTVVVSVQLTVMQQAKKQMPSVCGCPALVSCSRKPRLRQQQRLVAMAAA